MLLKCFVLFVLLNFVSVEAIYGGDTVTGNQYPWMAKINIYGRNSHQRWSASCGGTIISKNLILTAAHCVSDSEIISATVTIGNSNPQVGETININAIKIHPKHKRIVITNEFQFLLHDLAILRLAQDLNFDNVTIQPINLPQENYSDDDLLDRNKTKLSVIGWGKQQKLGM